MPKLILVALLFGGAIDLLFYGKGIGVSYPIAVMLFYSMFIYVLKDEIEFKFNFAWFLTIPIVGLSLTYFIYYNTFFRAVNFITIPILIVMQTMLLTKSNTCRFGSFGFIADMMSTLIEKILYNLGTVSKAILKISRGKKEETKSKNFKKVLIGIIMAFPLVIIVVALLAQADELFRNKLIELLEIFKYLNLKMVAIHLVIIIGIMYYVASYIISLMQAKEENEIRDIKKSETKGFFDPVIAITMLTSVNAVYLLFVYVQLPYLFRNLQNIANESFTYSEYARKGFFELVTVTVINLLIILINIKIVKKGSKGQNAFMKISNTIIVICTSVMLVSAHYKMSMYEKIYGYTFLRVISHLFMGYLIVMLIAALVKVWREKFDVEKAGVVISLVAYLLFNYISIDNVVLEKNIARYEQTGKVDVSYILDLSHSTLPKTVKFIEENETLKNEGIVNKIASKREKVNKEYKWQEFNISTYRAREVLK